jgi:predicted ATP-grasp superfamily ATP-dependent carboligase
VVGLDYFGDRDQRRDGETYALGPDFGLESTPENLVRAAAMLRYDAVAYAASLENHPDLVSRLAGAGGCRLLLGNSPVTLARVRRLPVLMRACRRAGINFPPSLLRTAPLHAQPQPPGDAPAADVPPVRWLRKPRAAGGGWGVRDWSAADGPPSRAAGTCLQRYVPGLPFSATFVANGRDAVVVGLAEGLAGLPQFGARGFAYCGSLVPPRANLDRLLALLPRLQEAATALTRHFGLVGLGGLDLIAGPRDGDVTLLEVNPRYSASMELIERAYAVPLFDWHVDASTAGLLPRFDLAAALSRSVGTATSACWGKSILFAHQSVAVPDTDSWLDAGVCDVPQSGETIRRGAPICTVLHAVHVGASLVGAQPDHGFHVGEPLLGAHPGHMGDACLAGLAARAARIEQELRPVGEEPPGTSLPHDEAPTGDPFVANSHLPTLAATPL